MSYKFSSDYIIVPVITFIWIVFRVKLEIEKSAKEAQQNYLRICETKTFLLLLGMTYSTRIFTQNIVHKRALSSFQGLLLSG